MLKKLFAVALYSWCAIAVAQTTEDLLNKDRNTENVTTQGMGYDLKNHSPLRQINKSNVKRLVPVWSLGLMNEFGETAQPTVYNGVMYAINAKWTVAIDVATGRQLWRTAAEWEPKAAAQACCGIISRGTATIYNGKLYRVTLDNHVLALDLKTGKQVWKQKFADYKEGYTATSAPLVANGVLITGMAGGEFTTRGFLNGWDPETGKHLWRFWTVPGARRERPRDVAQGHRRLQVRRRADVARRRVRPRARSRLLGHRQSGAVGAAQPRRARQPVREHAARDPAEDRRARVALPVHAERRVRRRRHRRAGARRHLHRPREAQGALPGQQERLHVHDRPHQREADRGARVHPRELGDAHRSQHRAARADRSRRPLHARRGGGDLSPARRQRRRPSPTTRIPGSSTRARGSCRGSSRSRRRRRAGRSSGRDPPASSRHGGTSPSRARSSAITSRWTRSAARRNGRSRSRRRARRGCW